MFLLIAIAVFIFFGLQMFFFYIVGEKLTTKIRSDCFKKLTHMPVAYFDVPKNNPGTLASRLASDASLVNQLVTAVVGINIGNLFTFISGMIIAFASSWRVTLVNLAIAPLVVVAA